MCMCVSVHACMCVRDRACEERLVQVEGKNHIPKTRDKYGCGMFKEGQEYLCV